MKIAFVFDTVLLKKENDYYGQTLTYDFFKERYLDKIDELIVITRSKNMKKNDNTITGYKKTNGKNVTISPILNYHQIPDIILKKRKIKKQMSNLLLECDKVIIRMPSILGIVACDICQNHNIPYMIEMVACAWEGYNNHRNPLGKILAPFIFNSTKRRVKNCNFVLYVTEKFLQERYPSKGASYSCSDVILPHNDDKVLEKNLEKIKKFNKKNFTMCTLGNVNLKYKGHIYAFKAIKDLKKKNINITYYLAGGGNQKYLKKMASKLGIENQIFFLGSLTHEEVFNLLDTIDVYIQPSLTEGLPRALVEAISRGCLCLGSDVGGIPELLDKNCLFKKKSSKSISSILMKLENVEKICIENYKKSKKFEKLKLDAKRNKIYNNFFNNL